MTDERVPRAAAGSVAGSTGGNRRDVHRGAAPPLTAASRALSIAGTFGNMPPARWWWSFSDGWRGRRPLPSLRAAGVVSVAAVIFIVYHLHRYGSARVMPAEMGLTNCLQFHRGELERQRDLLRSVWKWYLAPLVPGMTLVCLGSVLARPEHALPRAVGPGGDRGRLRVDRRPQQACGEQASGENRRAREERMKRLATLPDRTWLPAALLCRLAGAPHRRPRCRPTRRSGRSSSIGSTLRNKASGLSSASSSRRDEGSCRTAASRTTIRGR